MFVQLMKTKQVPEEDVQEMLEGEEKLPKEYELKLIFSEYKKLDFTKPEQHPPIEGEVPEEQIYYHGKKISPTLYF